MQNDISVNFTSIKNSMMNLVFIGHFFFYYFKALIHSNTLALRYFTSVLHQSCISSWIQQTK